MILGEPNAPMRPILKQSHFFGGIIAKWLHVAFMNDCDCILMNLVIVDVVT